MLSYVKNQCVEVMNKMMARPCAVVYLRNIYDIEDETEDEKNQEYTSDLEIIRLNLIQDKYKDLQHFENDLKNLWSKTEKIHKDYYVSILAKEFERCFKKEIKKVKLFNIKRWSHETSLIKDRLDSILESPAERFSPYVVTAQPTYEICNKPLSDREKNLLSRAACLMSAPRDRKEITSILFKYNIPLYQNGKFKDVDINSMSNQGLNELKSYIEKRLSDLEIPYPR